MAEASLDGEAAAAAQPVNGHPVAHANGAVPPEAAFWSALEDSKDEVRPLLLLPTCYRALYKLHIAAWLTAIAHLQSLDSHHPIVPVLTCLF